MIGATTTPQGRAIRHVLQALSAAAALASGCTAEQGTPSEAQARAAETQPHVVGLRIGDHGTEVGAVYGYLHSYGYFPNDDLAARYPSWRPLLAENPADPEEFDSLLEDAVRGFQAVYGLPISGVVDDQTMAALEQQRCSQPDSFARADEKFKVQPLHLGEDNCAIRTVGNTREITWQAEESNATLVAAFQSAATEWQRATSIRFRKVSSDGCIVFKRQRQMRTTDRANPSDPNENPIAVTLPFKDGGGRITHSDLTLGNREINGNAINWFTGSTPDPTRWSARVTLLHEIGHALGLGHSLHPSMRSETPVASVPIMFPSQGPGDPRWFLTDDDELGLRSYINSQRNLSLERGFFARSMDVARNGDVWEIDNGTPSNGNNLVRCNGQVVTGAATQVAVDFSRAWAVNAAGQVFRNRFVGCPNVSWEQIASVPLQSVAVNGDGIAWGLGRTIARNTQERNIFVFNGSQFVKIDGFATRVTVDSNGIALHVNQAGELYILAPLNPGCDLNFSSPTFGRGCWNRVGSGLWSNVHAGKGSFIWLLTRGAHMPAVINSTVNSPTCFQAGQNCPLSLTTENFGLWSNIADLVSDADGRLYLREGLIPNDNGPDFNSAGIIMVQ